MTSFDIVMDKKFQRRPSYFCSFFLKICLVIISNSKWGTLQFRILGFTPFCWMIFTDHRVTGSFLTSKFLPLDFRCEIVVKIMPNLYSFLSSILYDCKLYHYLKSYGLENGRFIVEWNRAWIAFYYQSFFGVLTFKYFESNWNKF